METTALRAIVLYLARVSPRSPDGPTLQGRERVVAVAGGGMSAALVAFGLAGARISGAGTYGVAGDVVT